MPPCSQFPPARVFLKMPTGAKAQPNIGVRRPSLVTVTNPTGRSSGSAALRSPIATPNVSSAAKFSTTTAIGREAGEFYQWKKIQRQKLIKL